MPFRFDVEPVSSRSGSVPVAARTLYGLQVPGDTTHSRARRGARGGPSPARARVQADREEAATTRDRGETRDEKRCDRCVPIVRFAVFL